MCCVHVYVYIHTVTHLYLFLYLKNHEFILKIASSMLTTPHSLHPSPFPYLYPSSVAIRNPGQPRVQWLGRAHWKLFFTWMAYHGSSPEPQWFDEHTRYMGVYAQNPDKIENWRENNCTVTVPLREWNTRSL